MLQGHIIFSASASQGLGLEHVGLVGTSRLFRSVIQDETNIPCVQFSLNKGGLGVQLKFMDIWTGLIGKPSLI